jgi:hypothetical protein
MDDKPAIEPQNVPMWIIASFSVAVIALLLAFVSLYRLNHTALITQAEVKILNNKIELLKQQMQTPPAPKVSSAPAQPAAEPPAAAPAK